MANRPVIFVIDKHHLQSDDGSSGAYPSGVFDIAALYHPALEAVLASPINRAGMVKALYVNLGEQGWFHIVPQAAGFFQDVSQLKLKDMLQSLFAKGTIKAKVTKQTICSRVPNIADVFANFPANTHILGCLSGEAAGNAITSNDYISAGLSDHTYVFVVGQFADGEIRTFVNETVKVSGYPLNPVASLYRICMELENKWNIL